MSLEVANSKTDMRSTVQGPTESRSSTSSKNQGIQFGVASWSPWLISCKKQSSQQNRQATLQKSGNSIWRRFLEPLAYQLPKAKQSTKPTSNPPKFREFHLASLLGVPGLSVAKNKAVNKADKQPCVRLKSRYSTNLNMEVALQRKKQCNGT